MTWKAWSTCSLIILEARNLESKYQQDWRGREYVTCFSSPFCWLPGSAWHSLACVISLLSLSLYLCIFSHHPLLPDFFLIETRPWLEDLPCTSGWSHLKISFQFQSSCFQVRFQPQIQGLGSHYICLMALFVYWEVLTCDLINQLQVCTWLDVSLFRNACKHWLFCSFFSGTESYVAQVYLKFTM